MRFVGIALRLERFTSGSLERSDKRKNCENNHLSNVHLPQVILVDAIPERPQHCREPTDHFVGYHGSPVTFANHKPRSIV